jgi:hypothetical protein
MENQIAIKIKYYALGVGNNKYVGENELIEFKNKVHENYFSTFEIQTAERGGGNFIVEFLYNITLSDFLSFILGGIVWDLVKGVNKHFFLRPFIELYKKFRERPGAQDIRDITFVFNDSRIYVYSTEDRSAEVDFDLIGKLFNKLAENYSLLTHPVYNEPKEIHIPLFLDNASLKTPIFRLKFDYDDPLYTVGFEFESDAYFKFWGLQYMDYYKCVFDVKEKQIIAEHWYDESEFEWYYEKEKAMLIKKKSVPNEKNT